MSGFWGKLNKSILCLAPMADVTDAAFRYLISKHSEIPYVTYTEFVSADGLVLAPEEGKKKLLKGFEYNEIERPIVAQLFTSKPEMMEKAARLVFDLGFDGVDINMGCPDRNVEKQGSGAGLIKNPKLARELIVAARNGVEGKIPVSVKTRLGYNKDELEKWLPELLAENPAAIAIHARTRKEMSKVPARWERIKRAVEIRDKIFQEHQKTLIIGNGDVESVEDALQKCENTGADGAMLGRAIFGDPWLFAKNKPTGEERLFALVEHAKLFEEKFEGFKNFAVMKKHFKSYLALAANAKDDHVWKQKIGSLKDELMSALNAEEVRSIVEKLKLS
jgi:nifR3 family TIM-barrel protein